jgi:hypothetical protein
MATHGRRMMGALFVLAGGAAAAHAQGNTPNHNRLGHTLQAPLTSYAGTIATATPAPSAPTADAANHLYVFCINGGDPIGFGNFNGMSQYLKSQGVPNTYYGQLWHVRKFHNEIKAIHASDPQAQFALIGYSFGANRVRTLANELNGDGIPVALLVYMAGDTITNRDYSRPANVARIVNVRSNGLVLYGGNWFFKGEELTGARNEFVNTRHMLLPSRSETIGYVTEELATLRTGPAVVGTPSVASPALASPTQPLPVPMSTASSGWTPVPPAKVTSHSPDGSFPQPR